MDLKIGDKVFILFIEDLDAEIVPNDYNDEREGTYQTFVAHKTSEEVEVVNIDEDIDAVDLKLENGVIYSVPREFFTLVPF